MAFFDKFGFVARLTQWARDYSPLLRDENILRPLASFEQNGFRIDLQPMVKMGVQHMECDHLTKHLLRGRRFELSDLGARNMGYLPFKPKDGISHIALVDLFTSYRRYFSADILVNAKHNDYIIDLEPQKNHKPDMQDQIYRALRAKFNGAIQTNTQELDKSCVREFMIACYIEASKKKGILNRLSINDNVGHTDSAIYAASYFDSHLKSSSEIQSIIHEAKSRIGKQRYAHAITKATTRPNSKTTSCPSLAAVA